MTSENNLWVFGFEHSNSACFILPEKFWFLTLNTCAKEMKNNWLSVMFRPGRFPLGHFWLSIPKMPTISFKPAFSKLLKMHFNRHHWKWDKSIAHKVQRGVWLAKHCHSYFVTFHLLTKSIALPFNFQLFMSQTPFVEIIYNSIVMFTTIFQHFTNHN